MAEALVYDRLIPKVGPATHALEHVYGRNGIEPAGGMTIRKALQAASRN